MSRLDDAASTVPVGPEPTDADPNLDAADDPVKTDPEPTGDKGDGKDPEGDKGDRSIDNVRGEFDRKYRKLQHDNEVILRELAELKNAPIHRPEPQAPAAPQTLDEMSILQLEQSRSNVPEESRTQFDAYLIERKAAERVDQKLNVFKQEQTFQGQEQKANEKAFSRWPALHDKASEFYRTTNQILQDMGPGADSNPTAVLHAANEAGLELQMSPSSYRPQIRREPGTLQGGRTSKPTKATADGLDDMNSEKEQHIQKNLQYAMPGQKFTPEQLERIAKRSKQYKDNIDLFTRG